MVSIKSLDLYMFLLDSLDIWEILDNFEKFVLTVKKSWSRLRNLN